MLIFISNRVKCNDLVVFLLRTLTQVLGVNPCLCCRWCRWPVWRASRWFWCWRTISLSTQPSWRWWTASCQLVCIFPLFFVYIFRCSLFLSESQKCPLGSWNKASLLYVDMCFFCLHLQVKFQACTPQKSLSRSSPLSRMQPRRTASPGRSTITSPSVSPTTLLTALFCVSTIIFVARLSLFLQGESFFGLIVTSSSPLFYV